jgi:hypothetical protein
VEEQLAEFTKPTKSTIPLTDELEEIVEVMPHTHTLHREKEIMEREYIDPQLAILEVELEKVFLNNYCLLYFF